MTNTTTWQGPQAPSSPRPATTALTRRKRGQPVLALAMVLAAVVFAGIGVVAYSRATASTSVLVATRTIPRGSHISPSDVTVASVRLPAGVPHVSASYLGEMDRYYATSTIPAATLLDGAELSRQSPITTATSLVGVVLSPPQHPQVLSTGETVQVVFVGSSSASNSSSAPPSTPPSVLTSPVPYSTLQTGQVLTTATVWQMPPAAPGSSGGAFSSSPTPTSSSIDVTLKVPAAMAPLVTAAAAANDVALALRPPAKAGG